MYWVILFAWSWRQPIIYLHCIGYSRIVRRPEMDAYIETGNIVQSWSWNHGLIYASLHYFGFLHTCTTALVCTAEDSTVWDKLILKCYSFTRCSTMDDFTLQLAGIDRCEGKLPSAKSSDSSSPRLSAVLSIPTPCCAWNEQAANIFHFSQEAKSLEWNALGVTAFFHDALPGRASYRPLRIVDLSSIGRLDFGSGTSSHMQVFSVFTATQIHTPHYQDSKSPWLPWTLDTTPCSTTLSVPGRFHQNLCWPYSTYKVES